MRKQLAIAILMMAIGITMIVVAFMNNEPPCKHNKNKTNEKTSIQSGMDNHSYALLPGIEMF